MLVSSSYYINDPSYLNDSLSFRFQFFRMPFLCTACGCRSTAINCRLSASHRLQKHRR
jgi:hypothetical protein